MTTLHAPPVTSARAASSARTVNLPHGLSPNLYIRHLLHAIFIMGMRKLYRHVFAIHTAVLQRKIEPISGLSLSDQ